jgi:hypothetical protein
MAKKHHHRSGESHRGDGGSEGNGNEREPYDDPEEHREIERSRFQGSLAATPERYARAREQWYRLPGSLVRPSMDPVIGEPSADEPHHPGQTHKKV